MPTTNMPAVMNAAVRVWGKAYRTVELVSTFQIEVSSARCFVAL